MVDLGHGFWTFCEFTNREDLQSIRFSKDRATLHGLKNQRRHDSDILKLECSPLKMLDF